MRQIILLIILTMTLKILSYPTLLIFTNNLRMLTIPPPRILTMTLKMLTIPPFTPLKNLSTMSQIILMTIKQSKHPHQNASRINQPSSKLQRLDLSGAPENLHRCSKGTDAIYEPCFLERINNFIVFLTTSNASNQDNDELALKIS
jgi:hypothetical protein